MEDLGVTASVSMSTENVERAFDRVGDKAAQMANKVAKEAEKAGAATDNMGASAEKSAEKFTRADSLMRAAIMKSTRELELLGKTASQRFEAQIDFKGLEKAKFQEAISGLQAMESALSVAKAREAEFAAQNAFSLKAAQAKELVKASEYARWWAQELEKVEAAEKRLAGQNSFIASLKSQADAIGKTKADLLEMQAAQMGVATQAAPFIAKMREAEAGVGKMGVSAAQTAAALRGVPAQFTDIVTSLQGGQAPLTVFLQQGGQLKDMFGGAGNAARALGGYVLGLINPFTLAAAGAAALAVAYNQGSKEADAYRLAMVGTGNAAGTTAGQLKSYAQEISGVIGTQGKAAESLAAFVSTGRVSRDVLKEASQAAIAWERATGQAVGATAKQFADLGKDPLQAVLKLNEGTNFLTESVYRQIKSLDEQGRTAEAAAVAQRAYADALTGRSATITQNLGYIEAAWKGITDAAKKSWDAMLNVGRASTPADATAELRTRLMRQQEELAAKKAINPYADTRGMEKGIEILKQRLGLLESDERQTRRLAEAEAERAKQMQATAAWDKEGAKYLTDKAKLERDLTVARNEGLAAGKSQAEIEKRLAQIRESYAKKGGSGGLAAENKDLRDQQRIFAELADVSSTYYADLATAQQQRAKGNLSEAQYVKYVEELIQKQPFAVAAAKAHAEAIKEETKAAAESSKSLSAWAEVRAKESQGLQNQINARREEVSMMDMTAEAVAAYTQAKYEQQAAEKEAYAAALESASFYAGEYAEAYNIAAEAARNQAKQLRELGGLEVEKVNKEAAKKAKDEWQRAADDINRSLTDALLRGFESGKDFAKNMRDTVVNMFKTMVLRPVISAIVSPIAGAAAGALGFSGTANAATAPSGVDVVGAISNGMSMLNTGISSAVQGTFSKFALSETGKSLGLSMAGPDASGYNMLSGTGQQMSQALGVVGDTLAGYAMGSMARSLISNGYSVGKGMDNFQKAGIAVGSALGGPVAGAIIGAGAGVFNQLFGRKLKDSGIQGTFGGTAGFDGEKYEFYKGGVFRSDKTKTSPLDQDTTDGLTQQFRAIQLSTGLMAETLGLASGAVASFTKDIKLSFKGLTEEQIQEKMAAELTAISDEMAGQVLGTLQSEYAKANETASQTLTRLSTSLITVNSAFELLGVAMLDASLASGDMASRLIEQSGGGEAFAANLGTYYENFYDPAEKTAYVTGQVAAALASVGLQMPKTREEFRALVESQIALGDSGTQAVAALLGVSGAFASVTETMKRLQSDTAGLQIELLRAQGNITGANAAQRTLDTSGMSAAEVAIYDYNAALRAQIASLNDAAAAAKTLADSRFGLENQLLTQVGQGDLVQQRVDQRDLAELTKGLPEEQAAKVREQFEANLKLRDQYAANQLAADNLAAAMGQLKEQQDAATQAQKDMLQSTVTSAKKAVDDLRSIFDFVGDAIKELRGDVVSTAGMQAEQARAFIQRASVLMRSGTVVDSGQLQAAIRTASGSVQTGAYASQFEADNARLLLANELAGLQDGTAGQLTVAEKHLSVAEQQLNALNVIAASINSLASAQSISAGQPRDQWARVQGQDVYASSGGAVGLNNGSDIDIYGKDGSRFTGSEAIAFVRNQIAVNDEASVYAEATKTGISAKALDELMGWAAGTSNDWAKANGLPQFAIGTNYVPRDMVAQIHEGEAIVPKAFNPWANGMTSSNPATERLLQQLVADNRVQAGEIVRLNTRIAKLMERWDGEGLPQARSEAAV